MKIKLHKITFNIYLFLILILAFLPSGTIANIPIKIILILVIIFSLIYIFLGSKKKLFSKLFLIKVIIYLFIILLYILIALYNKMELTSILKETQLISSFFIIFFIGIYFIKYYSINLIIKRLFLFAFTGSFLFVLSKSIILILMFTGDLNYTYIQNNIFPFINYTPVGLNIVTGFSRFSFVTLDFLSMYIIFFYLLLKIKYKKIFYFYLIFFSISFYSAYSRGLFLVFIILLILYILMYKKYKLFIVLSLISLIITYIYIDNIQLIINQRFLNQEHSDMHRVDMFTQLTTYWSESIIFGWGVGAYSPTYIRSIDYKFTYEMQLLSFIMKFGLIFIFLLFYINFLFIIEFLKRKNINIIFLYFMFLLWMILSMTNQYLFNSTVAVVALLMYASTIYFNKEKT